MENKIAPPHTVVIIGSPLISGGKVYPGSLSRSFEEMCEKKPSISMIISITSTQGGVFIKNTATWGLDYVVD